MPSISSSTCFIFHLRPGVNPAGKPEEPISANRLKVGKSRPLST
jgi:hypothetical protein